MSTLFAKFKPLLTLLVGFFAAVGVLSLTRVGPAQAQSPGVNLAALVARLNADDAKIATLQATTAPMTTTGSAAHGYLVTFAGANVQIVNGLGSSDTHNGLGNLIVGYNEKDSRYTQARTGSHNIVGGAGNNYLSYGGLVVGQSGLISGAYATITGGKDNVAKSDHASVTGGNGNLASGPYASVTGGQGNTANGGNASVTGGSGNTAIGGSASVGGGRNNIASGSYASVSGGDLNIADNYYAVISGGGSNTASGNEASVSGGFNNRAIGNSSSISGGQNRNQAAANGWTAGSEGDKNREDYVGGTFRSP